MENKKEQLAKLCHEQWSGWMEYVFYHSYPEVTPLEVETGAVIIPKWAVERWERQIETPYSELSEQEKDSDRREADKILQLLNK